MNRDVRPDNPEPILVCGGVSRCGWQPHRFVRTDRMPNGSGRQIFRCGKCETERLFGVVDLRMCGREAVS